MRFSILTLLGLVAVAAVGCAALLNANDVWAEVCYSVTFITLLVAFVAGLILRGGTRAFCIGFAVFGLAYFSDGLFDKSALLSTTLSDYVSKRIEGLPPDERIESAIQTWDSLTARRGQPANVHFVIVFNSIFSLVYALFGGFVARYFYWLRQKQDAGVATQPL